MQSGKYFVIVDGFGGGRFLPWEFRKRGMRGIHVQSTPELLPIMIPTFRPEAYEHHVAFDGDLQAVVDKLRPFTPVCLLPGDEGGVQLADRLSEAMGLPTNGTRRSEARRNKYDMIEAVRNHGLRAAQQFKSNDAEAIVQWGLMQASPEDASAVDAQLTYGPDLNISTDGLTDRDIVDVGRKLTYYSPFIVPFSYSAPFFGGGLWHGLSIRTYRRTGIRPAVLVYLRDRDSLLASNPTLTRLARGPCEVGRIEFKACDSCADFSLYAGLLALLKGLFLDSSLHGRSTVPDRQLHQRSAMWAFSSDDVAIGCETVVAAAQKALVGDADQPLLAPLQAMLRHHRTQAHDLIDAYRRTRSVTEALTRTYASQLVPTANTVKRIHP